MSFNRLVIIGAGAIGGSIGGLIAAAQLPVVLVARGPHGQLIRHEGLTVKFPFRSVHSNPECVETIDSVDLRRDDAVIVATKLNDTVAVLDQLVELAGTTIPIVSASNGLQGELWTETRFESVISMMVWMPSVHLSPGDVRVFGEDCPGVLDVGPWPSTGNHSKEVSVKLAEWLRIAGFDSKFRQDIKRWKYAKWVTNLGNTAQALVVDDWKSVAKAAQAEGERVLDAAKVDRVSTKELLQRASHIRLRPIESVKRPGGSTWQSLQRGKPLETRWLEGAMAELGEQVGVRAEVCRALDVAADKMQLTTADEIFACRNDR